jgi:hypothetical protein
VDFGRRADLIPRSASVDPRRSRAEGDQSAPVERGSVFVDELFTAVSRQAKAYHVGQRNSHQWCHMWSEDLQALHVWLKIGLKRSWFQNRPGFLITI